MSQVALSIADYTSGTSPKAKANLAEILSGVLENIQTNAVSEQIKAKNGSGTPEAGVIEYKRFANATLQNLGSARSNGKGVSIEDKPVKVNIDDDKEIVEEVAGKDVKLYGVDNIARRRADNQAKRIKAYLDTKFFTEATTNGTSVTVTGLTTTQEKIDKMIVTAKTTSNDFIDGIDAEDLVLVLSPSYRKDMKKILDACPNGTNPANSVIGLYDSIETHESTRLGSGINAVVMLKGAIAQPFYVDETAFEKIPLSDDYAIENFLHCGTKALMPDTIYYI